MRAARADALKARRDRNIGLSIIVGVLVLACCLGACLIGVPASIIGAF